MVLNVKQPEDINKDEDAEVILKTGSGEIKFTAKSKLKSELRDWCRRRGQQLTKSRLRA
jgi:hypothetical protein